MQKLSDMHVLATETLYREAPSSKEPETKLDKLRKECSKASGLRWLEVSVGICDGDAAAVLRTKLQKSLGEGGEHKPKAWALSGVRPVSRYFSLVVGVVWAGGNSTGEPSMAIK